MIKKIIPDSMPKLPKIGLPSLPSRNTVAKLVPGMSERDKEDAEDPDVPFIRVALWALATRSGWKCMKARAARSASTVAS